ncbi:MAG: DUF2290 domain-containing protein, partial [Spongiibacter marinus]|uniref:DUF2290 domain-containing protein n=1 Tax=Spongiibacter marinus TaxID=354246 RepID=UPI003C319B48
MELTEVSAQIRKIIIHFVEKSIALNQNFPAIRQGRIGLKSMDLSYMLSNSAYDDVYRECLEKGDYHLQMLDGALIQFQYTFDDENLIKHRLSYLPHPDFESYCENPEFEKEIHGDLLFSDIKMKSS